MKKVIASGIIFLFLLSLISTQETEPEAENIPLGVPPIIDGVISPGEWTTANTKPVELESYDGDTRNAEIYLEYDNETFYFALVVEGESEEVYLWLGDDESQAFQKGTDLKRCPKSNDYTCSDWYYKELYDFVEDDQQDGTGAGSYDAETDKTTVELEIPFNSGDANDYQIDCSKVFIIIYGSIHKSSPDKEYKDTKPVAFWAEHFKTLAIISEGEARSWENRAEGARKGGNCFLAAEYFMSAALAWGNAATGFRNSAKYWREEARYLRQAAEVFYAMADQENEGKARDRANKADKMAEEAEKEAKLDDGRVENARNNAKAAEEETIAREPEPEEPEENGSCHGTVFAVLLVFLGAGVIAQSQRD